MKGSLLRNAALSCFAVVLDLFIDLVIRSVTKAIG
jgi:hypothetical protein